MGKIKQKNTKPELLVRDFLRAEGFRIREQVSDLPGSPDFILPWYQVAIFVHGCYWHRHHCRRGQSMPTNRREFWQNKFEKNVRRDINSKIELEALGYRVLVVWECELKRASLNNTLDNLLCEIRTTNTPSISFRKKNQR